MPSQVRATENAHLQSGFLGRREVLAILCPVHKNKIIAELYDAIIVQNGEVLDRGWIGSERCRQN
jgi:hypothetical protein